MRITLIGNFVRGLASFKSLEFVHRVIELIAEKILRVLRPVFVSLNSIIVGAVSIDTRDLGLLAANALQALEHSVVLGCFLFHFQLVFSCCFKRPVSFRDFTVVCMINLRCFLVLLLIHAGKGRVLGY